MPKNVKQGIRVNYSRAKAGGQLIYLAPLGARQTYPLLGVNPIPPLSRVDSLFIADKYFLLVPE